eukprot:CAMPEP_0182900054 /NCGR_PEP_ID=MMETSP0034_2-20130328/28531_1 /TAXON_ID=156128 /ORGANISM="Nephroselmis pyriformis, Strain CCMP717" /LENGTH=407 /DNA_ID=CAMNT_0025034181 /DNA_START=124 /DNA_END=1344 /DNA_ORIENTATION=+
MTRKGGSGRRRGEGARQGRGTPTSARPPPALLKRLGPPVKPTVKGWRAITGAIDGRTTWADLKDWGKQIAMVVRSEVIFWEGVHRGFLEYSNESDLDKAVRSLTGSTFNYQPMHLQKDLLEGPPPPPVSSAPAPEGSLTRKLDFVGRQHAMVSGAQGAPPREYRREEDRVGGGGRGREDPPLPMPHSQPEERSSRKRSRSPTGRAGGRDDKREERREGRSSRDARGPGREDKADRREVEVPLAMLAKPPESVRVNVDNGRGSRDKVVAGGTHKHGGSAAKSGFDVRPPDSRAREKGLPSPPPPQQQQPLPPHSRSAQDERPRDARPAARDHREKERPPPSRSSRGDRAPPPKDQDQYERATRDERARTEERAEKSSEKELDRRRSGFDKREERHQLFFHLQQQRLIE